MIVAFDLCYILSTNNLFLKYESIAIKLYEIEFKIQNLKIRLLCILCHG